MSSSGWAQTVSIVAPASHGWAAGEDTAGVGGGVGVALGVSLTAGVGCAEGDFVETDEADGDAEAATGSPPGRRRANAKTPATALTTTTAMASAAMRPAERRRRAGLGRRSARDIEGLPAAGGASRPDEAEKDGRRGSPRPAPSVNDAPFPPPRPGRPARGRNVHVSYE
ncbi:hypothetical protein CHE218_15170 [Microbacterium sp. che218]